MHHGFVFLLTMGLSLSLTATVATDSDVSRRLKRLEHKYHSHVNETVEGSTCSRDNIGVRREWETLDPDEKQDFIRAILCLQSNSSATLGSLSQSRYDDYVLSHIEQTLFIHFSGLLLPWHRYYLFLFEQSLRDECGYTGYLPYWDWSKSLENKTASTLFDGSEYSLSGDGEPLHQDVTVISPGGPRPRTTFIRPAGTGGGCVQGGVFANRTISLDGRTLDDGVTYSTQVFDRPRCITRDFYRPFLEECCTYEKVADLIENNTDIHSFHSLLEDQESGVHANGHIFIGGENLDFYASPNDPVFFLHHAMIDRVWAIWQGQDPGNRNTGLDGTVTFMNVPPSPNATLETLLEFGNLTDAVQMSWVMSPLDGPFCYEYQ